ncbi:hypothetical protein AVAK2825_23060 [Acidovorax sp. SUPP2825]|nr:hypothetical protein AVAK2825_23060 [Acidovorax sp. SUPP2825]
MPPNPWARRYCSHARPSSWYGRSGTCSPAGAQGLDAPHLPGAQAQRVAVLALPAGVAQRIGEQVHHRTDDGLERRRGRIDAPPAGRAQRDGGVVVDGGHLRGVQPARFAPEQIGQQGRQVQRLAVHLDAQAQQPGPFAFGQMQLLHRAFARAQRAGEVLAQQLAGVGVQAQRPALHGNALVREAGQHRHGPAMGL